MPFKKLTNVFHHIHVQHRIYIKLINIRSWSPNRLPSCKDISYMDLFGLLTLSPYIWESNEAFWFSNVKHSQLKLSDKCQQSRKSEGFIQSNQLSTWNHQVDNCCHQGNDGSSRNRLSTLFDCGCHRAGLATPALRSIGISEPFCDWIPHMLLL